MPLINYQVIDLVNSWNTIIIKNIYTSQELLSSGIEDGMIYSLFDVSYENGTTGNVLYINDPETLNFVAVTVDHAGISTNYQFVY